MGAAKSWSSSKTFQEQFWWPSNGKRNFETLVRQHLTNYLLDIRLEDIYQQFRISEEYDPDELDAGEVITPHLIVIELRAPLLQYRNLSPRLRLLNRGPERSALLAKVRHAGPARGWLGRSRRNRQDSPASALPWSPCECPFNDEPE